MSLYLLDTNILVGYIRGATWAREVHDKYNLSDSDAMVFTSIICHGEMLALARKLNWGKNKQAELEKILNEISMIDINHKEILDAYALIDAWTHGKSVACQQSPPPKPAIPMGQNDLWIAATARASNATLLSTDKDFAHLNRVWIEYVYVDQTK